MARLPMLGFRPGLELLDDLGGQSRGADGSREVSLAEIKAAAVIFDSINQSGFDG